jgi:hypothetical protein
MKRTPLDDRTADRLLAGAVTPEDAPPGFSEVADLLQTARPRPAVGELANQAATVASMRAAIAGQPVPHPRSRRKKMLARLLTAKAVAAAAVVVIGAGSAAAATGTLPGAAQSTASDMLAKVGVSVPGPDSHSKGHADTRGKSATKPADPSATHPTTGPGPHADFGLCTAEAANAGHPNPAATVFPSATTCSTVVHPGGQGQGQPPADPGSQGQGQPPANPGSQGQGQPPANPGSQGQGQGQGQPPAHPGSQGQGNPPANPGSQGQGHEPAGSGGATPTPGAAASTGLGTAGSTPAAGHVPTSVPPAHP